jgi:ribonuclease T2
MRSWFGLLALAPTVALAQAQSCRIPDRIDIPDATRPADQPVHVVPVRGYTLALSWSPQYCRDHPQDESGQCNAASGRFGFIIHGLWPEGAGRDYPAWCPSQARLTEAVVKAQFCATPSTRLIAHEWAKHGTCAARDPGDYFAAARKLFANVRIPDMDALSRRTIDVGGFKRVLSAANPAIKPSSLGILSNRQGWLNEVHICLNMALRPEPCPRNRSNGAPDGVPLKIWRGGG